MISRTNHCKPLPQRLAETGTRARLLQMQRGGSLFGVRKSAVVDPRTSDPGGEVVM